MREQTTLPPQVRRRHHWRPDAGDRIELRQNGIAVQVGRVETVMPDGSGFWIAPEGPNQRRYIPVGDETFEIWA